METKEIQELLQAYVQHGSESAFRDLVRRYINLVYSTALRQLGGRAHLAEDVAQTVFTDLARKARTLPPDVLLGGWLHKHTCYVAANVSRSERRRADRENQSAQMNTLNNDPDETWKKIAPVLDDAINELNPEDRDALMLRYFEQRDFRSIGATLGVSDDTAQKRVSRALEKLRGLLVNHGVTLSATALATLLTNQVIASLPLNLAENVAGTALTKAGGSGALKTFLSVKMGLIFLGLITVAVFTPSIVTWISGTISSEQVDANIPFVESTQTVEENNAPVFTEQSPQISTSNSRSAATENSDSLNHLTLTILSVDTQRPIPNATVDFRAQAGKWVTKKLTADRDGVCAVEILPDLKTLQLTTQIKGFADTRLSWNVSRGEIIPKSYKLAVERAVLIGGMVLDPDGNPVEGAKVGFNHDDDLTGKKSPESHEFSWIEVQSDREGRWQIDRIADGMIRRLRGGAKHTSFLDANYLTVARDAGAEKELRKLTHVFRLGKGITIHGFVIGPDRQIVPGAKVFFAGRGMSHRRETISGPDGSFSLNGCRPDKDTLSAEANGFATTTIEVEGGLNSGPYYIELQFGKTLRMRVQNERGEPIPRANVWLDIFGNSMRGTKAVPVQANFAPRTDMEGRVIWTNAPDTELAFDISASGYLRSNGIKMRPDGDEHIVTLRKALVVSGNVRGENGQPIPRFRIICGYPQKNVRDGAAHPSWSTLERFWLSFAGGSYKHTFEEAVIGGSVNPGYILKFEAEGYAPYISRILEPDEGEVQLDVTLKKANAPFVVVLRPDGQPAVRADVGLISPGTRLTIGFNGLSRENIQSGGSLLSTDEKGQFRLSSDETIFRILITSPEGFADTTPAALMAKPTVHLQPWGALKGNYVSDGTPLVGRDLILGFENSGIGGSASLSYSFQHKVRTDSDGNFSFPKVLPGTHKLIALIPNKVPANSWSHSPLQNVTIRSGETTTVKIGDTSYKIVAHIRFPQGANPEGMRIGGLVHVPGSVPPAEIMNNPEARQRWEENPENKKLAQLRKYPLKENSGFLSAENVEAGSYEISVMGVSLEKSEEGKQAATFWRGRTALTVPESPATGTIDVGEIELQPIPSK